MTTPRNSRKNSFELQISESAYRQAHDLCEVAERCRHWLKLSAEHKLSLNPSFSLINKEKQGW